MLFALDILAMLKKLLLLRKKYLNVIEFKVNIKYIIN